MTNSITEIHCIAYFSATGKQLLEDKGIIILFWFPVAILPGRSGFYKMQKKLITIIIITCPTPATTNPPDFAKANELTKPTCPKNQTWATVKKKS